MTCDLMWKRSNESCFPPAACSGLFWVVFKGTNREYSEVFVHFNNLLLPRAAKTIV